MSTKRVNKQNNTHDRNLCLKQWEKLVKMLFRCYFEIKVALEFAED